jgi:hypothetical protein
MKTYNWEILVIDKRPSSIFFGESSKRSARKNCTAKRVEEKWEQFNKIIFHAARENENENELKTID